MNKLTVKLERERMFACLILVTLITAVTGSETLHCIDNVTQNITASHSTIVTRLADEQHYSDDLHCGWYIQAPEGKRIHVTVISSDLQYAPSGSSCYGYDFVGVQEERPVDDGRPRYYNIAASHSFHFCGNHNPQAFSSIDSNLFIEFVSTDRNLYDERGATMEIEFFSNHTCPPGGWVEDDSLLDDPDESLHCYKLRTQQVSWHAAQGYCRYEHANLVSIANEREADFIEEYIESRDDLAYNERVWIGLNDIKHEGNYVWIDQISSTASYRWYDSPHKPNVFDHCLSVKKTTGEWKEEYCSAGSIESQPEHPFICKVNKYGVTRTYLPPADRSDVEGKGSDAPIIAIIISVCIFVLFIVALVLLCIFCARTRRRNASKRPTVTESDIPLRTPLNTVSQPTEPSAPSPPSYEVAIGAR